MPHPVCSQCPHLSGFAQDIVGVENETVEAIAEAATYRQLFLLTLDFFSQSEAKRIGAELRLRQLSGLTAWHPEETDESR